MPNIKLDNQGENAIMLGLRNESKINIHNQKDK